MALADNVAFNLDASTTHNADDLTSNIAKENAFVMTNADDDNETSIPSDLSPYTVESNPFNLGTFNLERTAARFDYGQYKTDNKYTVITNTQNEAVVDIQLTDIALVNLSKSYYHFRRVSLEGTSTNWIVGGDETANNYVVDTDWQLKVDAVNNVNSLPANFIYPLKANDESGLTWTALSSISTEDNYDSGDLTYKVWRYATENTIPADPTKNQINAASTGVVFRAKLLPGTAASEGLAGVINAAKEPIYLFQNTLYGTWEMVEAAVKANDKLVALYNAVNTVKTADGKLDAAKLAAAGFTQYSPRDINADGTADGYYTTYYYWNRHNDNNDNTVMGPMEFAVVRNNVYKLAVTKISRLGHPYNPDPENPDPDPDPIDPTDPDEEIEYYFQVSVKVLPWIVRINNIEF